MSTPLVQIQPEKNTVPIRVQNLQPESVVLRKGTIVGDLQPCGVLEDEDYSADPDSMTPCNLTQFESKPPAELFDLQYVLPEAKEPQTYACKTTNKIIPLYRTVIYM